MPVHAYSLHLYSLGPFVLIQTISHAAPYQSYDWYCTTGKACSVVRQTESFSVA